MCNDVALRSRAVVVVSGGNAPPRRRRRRSTFSDGYTAHHSGASSSWFDGFASGAVASAYFWRRAIRTMNAVEQRRRSANR